MSKAELLELLEELPDDVLLLHNSVGGFSVYQGLELLGNVDFLHKKLVLVEKNK